MSVQEPLIEKPQKTLSNVQVECIGYRKLSEIVKEINLNRQIDYDELGYYVYLFRVTRSNKKWEIRRRVEDFKVLERVSNRGISHFFKHKNIPDETAQDNPEETKHNLMNFLNKLLNSENPPEELYRFLEISHIDYEDLKKFKECILKKKAGGRFSETRCARCGTLWGRWSKRLFSITNHGVMYAKGEWNDEAQIRESLIFDHSFNKTFGVETGHERGIKLEFASRHLNLSAPDMFTLIDFMYALKLAMEACPYLQLHRFNSFAPIRQSQCKWYVDGEEYFGDVMDALLKAKQRVYITDWWLSPELFLKRPISTDENNLINKNSRLDRILKNIADQNVSVYILVYQESTFALSNDSLHTMNYLQSLSRNIIVRRHPSQTIPSFWSHHEKMVVIDNKVGFMGGLDLCFGRMDNQKHVLTDPEPVLQFWPGIDFVNNRKKDFVNVRQHETSLIDRRTDARMPWHDIAIQIVGESVNDMARHFIQYWNHVIIDQDFGARHNKMLQGLSHKVGDAQRQSVILGPNNQFKRYVQKMEEETNQQGLSEASEEKQLNTRRISATMRNSIISRDIVNFMKDVQPPIEVSNEDLFQKHASQTPDEGYNRHAKITHQNSSDNAQILQFQSVSQKTGSCETQLLRSASNWSIGLSSENTEFSIRVAYDELILSAKHYIYIENQFFISCSADTNVRNEVAKALVQRISKAAQQCEPFKVIVFIPLLPGFEGEIDGNSAVMKVQLHWEYQTISRGGNSILEQLRKDPNIRDPEEFIEFYSLRTHAMINGAPKTEQIYIHSKLMIVDDDIVLMGSANINDRSLLGNRDSELAVVVEDQSKVHSQMAGLKCQRSRFAQSLRCSLYMEHFGLSYEEVIDPLSFELQDKMREIAKRNTQIYREVFACYPDDEVKTLSDFASFKNSGNLSKYDEKAQQIKGHAVEFPLEFLVKENLKFGIFQKEILMPEETFT